MIQVVSMAAGAGGRWFNELGGLNVLYRFVKRFGFILTSYRFQILP